MFKKLNIIMFSCLITFGLNSVGFAEEYYDDDFIEDVDFEDNEYNDLQNQSLSPIVNNEQDEYELAEQVSIQTLQDYNAAGSLFEKITMLEQEKVVVQLEKERAQLDLELDRLNAERIKLQMELDTLSGRAEQQQQELEAAKTQLEIQTEKLKQQRDFLDDEDSNEKIVVKAKQKKEETDVTRKYKLINVVGVNNQLQATIEEISTGQNKRIAVGKELDGYIVKSISLNDGIVFEKDGIEESLNIGK